MELTNVSEIVFYSPQTATITLREDGTDHYEIIDITGKHFETNGDNSIIYVDGVKLEFLTSPIIEIEATANEAEIKGTKQ